MKMTELQYLLVEGKDDFHVISSLCDKFSINQNFTILDCNGIDKLFETLPVRFKESGLKTIGIIVDADSDILSRWNHLKELIRSFGFVVEDEIPCEGLKTTNKKNQSLGVWIMPDNKTSGMLEDFIRYLIPDEDELANEVNNTLDNIESLKLNKYKPIYRSKAFIHNWLSFQETPGSPLGAAITRSYLSTNSDKCMNLMNWLKNLFIEK